LKLQGKDWGDDHTLSGAPDSNGSQYDGKIDTWIVDPTFLSSPGPVVFGSDTTSYWQPLFSDDINVQNLLFYLYPNKDLRNSWRDTDPDIEHAPYLRVQAEVLPSWNVKRKIKGKVPSMNLSTTIHLTDIFSY